MLTSRPDAERIRRTPDPHPRGRRRPPHPESALRRTADLYGADLTLLPDTAHDIMLENELAASRRRHARLAQPHPRVPLIRAL